MNYVFMFIAGLLGQFLHIMVKIKGIRKRNPDLGPKEAWKTYWKEDWNSIIAGIVGILAVMFIIKEWLNIPADSTDAPSTIAELVQYKIKDYVRTSFLVIGYCIDALVYAWLGTAERKLLDKAKDAGVDVE